jgi:hypothetical protein
MPEETAHGALRSGNGSSRVSFSELARAHYRWDQSEDSDTRKAFRDAMSSFEGEAGEIIDAYWCRKDASAVALTKKRIPARGRLARVVGPCDDEYRLFRVSDWVTAGTRGVADLLHDCDVLAIKAANGLEGIPQAVVMQWLHAVESHVLGFIERHRDAAPSQAETTEFIRRQRAELARIDDYYQRAGEKRARLRYVEGMLMLGVPILGVLAALLVPVLALFGTTSLKTDNMRALYVSIAAGGIGAVVSVLMRMSRGANFTIDHELGRRGVRELGIYRPLIGAVSGVIVYYLVQTPLVPIDEETQTFEFYAVVAFLAGFSERWTRVTLSGAMRTVGGDADEEQKDGRQTEGAPAGATT